jgi:hypothetical protein
MFLTDPNRCKPLDNTLCLFVVCSPAQVAGSLILAIPYNLTTVLLHGARTDDITNRYAVFGEQYDLQRRSVDL